MSDKKLPTKVVKASDCPLSCPTPDMPVWDQHPRVFLPIEKERKVSCPYCGTRFELLDEA